MKQRMKKPLSLLTALALLWSLSIPAAASFALGDDLTSRSTELHRETRLSTNVFWSTSSSDLRTENFITYRPGGDVMPMVRTGYVVTEKSTVSTVAKELEAAGYRVVAGINGDFYSVGSGVPVGIVVTEGNLRCGDGGFHAIGFRADGSAILGKPAVSLSASLGYNDINGNPEIRRITDINKARESEGGTYLYTYDFNKNHTTGNTEPGIDVICNIVEGRLAIGETLVLSVAQVVEATSATAVGENQVVLSVNLKSDAYQVEGLRNVPVGAVISVTATPADPAWSEVEYAMGALYSLVENGAVVPGLPTGAAPRTAVGQTPEGDVIFYTIDGRRPGHSIGASMTQVAERLIELGCVTALCLDGGGSTTISVTKPDQLTAQTINRPSDGGERAVTNQLFLVASNQPTGVLDHFYVQAEHDYVLAGSGVKISAAAVDTNYIPMTEGYTLEASQGEMLENTLMTPSSGGEISVTARSGESEGTVTVHAIANPTSVTLRNSGGSAINSLTVAPGGTVTLTGAASFGHVNLYATPEAFTWSTGGGIGEIDQMGNFTASTPGAGTITASAGSCTATVQVTVSGSPLQLLEDFEDGETIFESGGYGTTLTSAAGTEYVRLGRGAGKWDYTLDTYNDYGTGFETQLTFASAVAAAPYDTLNLWVYGDNSGNTLSLLYQDAGGTGREEPIAVLDFTGWKQLSVTLTPLEARELLGLSLGREADITLSDGGSGTVYLDHLLLSRGGTVDVQPPAVTGLKAENSVLSAAVQDAVDGAPARELVAVTYDGKPLEFTYQESAGTVSAALPASDGAAHRVTVTARDVSGNIGRASLDIAAAEDWTPHFADTKGYWAAAYVDYLYTAGVTTGYGDGSFRPNQNITRAQFAAMLYRYLKLEDAPYAEADLPFADAGQIADYALPAIRALYTEGIINGSTGKDGKLYFNPNSSLTRAQAATMIGRTQEKGYASAALSFTDADKIPAYALPYIQTMTAQGIISGYDDNTFRPGNNITRGQMAKILYNLM